MTDRITECGCTEAHMEQEQKRETESWLQTKVAAQKKALRRLDRRVVAQRAVLRKLTDLGYALTFEQWTEVREAPMSTDRPCRHCGREDGTVIRVESVTRAEQ